MNKIDRNNKNSFICARKRRAGVLLQFVKVSQAESQPKTASNQSGEVSPIIKTGDVIIADEKGRERVISGAPVPALPHEGKRISPGHGMIILDPGGRERFGVGLMDYGNLGMGFDAPPGKGNDRNRERIHIVADKDGGAMIRFLNRQTGVLGWLRRLGEGDKLYLEFIDIQKDKNKVIRHKYGMNGKEAVEEAFKK